MAIKTYQVNDFWLDIDKENHVDIESTDGVITSVKNNGEDIGGGGSTWNTVFEGNVTTEKEGTLYPTNTDDITLTLSGADRIKVTFNGQEYELPKVLVGDSFGYGALSNGNPDLNQYPLFIGQNSNLITVFTQSAGTYTLKIEEPQSGGGGSSDFSTAEVTVNVEGYSAGMPRYYIANAVHVINDELRSQLSIPLPSLDYTNPISAVLYKGNTEWQINSGSDNIPIASVVGTGDIEVSEYSGDYVISITGDGSLTITYGDGGK